MKIGYSQADVAKAYYDKVNPGNGYDNRKANNQFCQDNKIDWDVVIDIVNELNSKSFNGTLKIRTQYLKEQKRFLKSKS